MNINQLLARKNLTKYRLSKDTQIPYSTISDICNGKAALENCAAGIILRIAKVLEVSMEALLEPQSAADVVYAPRKSFEAFKSNICHRVKDAGDLNFITEVLEQDFVRLLFQKEHYPEAFYLLAMLDYISRENSIPLATRYSDIRVRKLENIIYPASILALTNTSNGTQYQQESLRNAIPEFMRFNIVESEVRNIV